MVKRPSLLALPQIGFLPSRMQLSAHQGRIFPYQKHGWRLCPWFAALPLDPRRIAATSPSRQWNSSHTEDSLRPAARGLCAAVNNVYGRCFPIRSSGNGTSLDSYRYGKLGAIHLPGRSWCSRAAPHELARIFWATSYAVFGQWRA